MGKFDKQFKKDAVNHLIVSGKTVREVSEALGVSKSSLHLWKQQYAASASSKELEKDDELAKLRRENADLKMERDILKKATAIFSRMQV